MRKQGSSKVSLTVVSNDEIRLSLQFYGKLFGNILRKRTFQYFRFRPEMSDEEVTTDKEFVVSPRRRSRCKARPRSGRSTSGGCPSQFGRGLEECGNALLRKLSPASGRKWFRLHPVAIESPMYGSNRLTHQNLATLIQEFEKRERRPSTTYDEDSWRNV